MKRNISKLTRPATCCLIAAGVCLGPANPASAQTNTVTNGSAAAADNTTPIQAYSSPDYYFDLDLRLWLFGVSGDIGARALTASGIDENFMNILDDSGSVPLSSRIEVGKDPWALYIDGTYADIKAKDQTGNLIRDIDASVEMGVIDFGLMYRLTEWKQPSSDTNGSLDVYAGGRYVISRIELDPALLPAMSKKKDWVDPLIGVRIKQSLSKKLHLDVAGDIGGFGVASDMTWSASTRLGIDFELFDRPLTGYIGYRAMCWDYENGSGINRFAWDTVLHGPEFGLVVLSF